MSLTSQHYNQYYRYDLPPGQDPATVVNGLFDDVMRNDRAALEEVLKILSSNTYHLIHSRLAGSAFDSLDSLDEIMQNVRVEVIQMSFRGCREEVTGENFFWYLLGLTENQIKNYMKRSNRSFVHEIHETEEKNVLDNLNEESGNERFSNPEDAVIDGERAVIYKEVVSIFMKALQETELEPYKIVVFCYSVLIPQFFKNSDDTDYLVQINDMCSRNGQEAKSGYDLATGTLYGDVTRKSSILMKFAYNSMYKEQAKKLSKEFVSLYNNGPFLKNEFIWGNTYCEKMKKDYNGQAIENLVITDAFTCFAMKNYPTRIMKSLIADTRNLAHASTDFRKRSVGYAEAVWER